MSDDLKYMGSTKKDIWNAYKEIRADFSNEEDRKLYF
jgi:hypothetical protein